MHKFDSLPWCESRRPKTIDDCILPPNVKSTFEQFIVTKKIPNLLLHSSVPGCGKTTVCRALCEQLDYEYLFINASEQRGIDVLRNDITQFISNISLYHRNKAVLMDEFDNCTPTAQLALRAFIEQYAHVRFFFTCNYVDRIPEPILSRCTVISFDWKESDHKAIKNKFYQRVIDILKEENIEYKKEVVIEIIRRFSPDLRRILNELQTYAVSGVVDEGLLDYNRGCDLFSLFKLLKNREYGELIKWVDTTPLVYESFYDRMFKEGREFVVRDTLPHYFRVLGKYQTDHMICLNKQINLMALVTELLDGVKYK